MYGFQVSHISECVASKCLTYQRVSHIRMYGVQVPHIFECMVSKCLTYSSVWFLSASHIRVYGSASHNHAIHSVSYISKCWAPKCQSVWHIQVSHMLSIRCLTHPSAGRPSVPHIRVYGFQVSHISECMVSKCRSVSHIRAYGSRLSHISKCIT